MSMEDLWPRQSVHGWVLFLGIKSVYNDYKQQKWKKLKVKEIKSVGLLLAMAVVLYVPVNSKTAHPPLGNPRAFDSR